MITLPKNPKNTEERMSNGIASVMNYICKQIEHCLSNPKDDNDVVAVVKTGSCYGKYVCNGVNEEWFPNDIIKKAMSEVINQGYFVWYDRDHMGDYTYWVTATNNRPHPWFRPFA